MVDFALALSFEGISLLRRIGSDWAVLGEVPIDHPDLDAAVLALRDQAEQLDPKGSEVALVIPNEQIRYLDQPDPGGDAGARDEAVRTALDGATPYALTELTWDSVQSGGRLLIAAVAHDTLDEAETFATDHGFTPVCHQARAETGKFDGAVFFGRAKGWTSPVPRPSRAMQIVPATPEALTPVGQPVAAPEPEVVQEPVAEPDIEDTLVDEIAEPTPDITDPTEADQPHLPETAQEPEVAETATDAWDDEATQPGIPLSITAAPEADLPEEPSAEAEPAPTFSTRRSASAEGTAPSDAPRPEIEARFHPVIPLDPLPDLSNAPPLLASDDTAKPPLTAPEPRPAPSPAILAALAAHAPKPETQDYVPPQAPLPPAAVPSITQPETTAPRIETPSREAKPSTAAPAVPSPVAPSSAVKAPEPPAPDAAEPKSESKPSPFAKLTALAKGIGRAKQTEDAETAEQTAPQEPPQEVPLAPPRDPLTQLAALRRASIDGPMPKRAPVVPPLPDAKTLSEPLVPTPEPLHLGAPVAPSPDASPAPQTTLAAPRTWLRKPAEPQKHNRRGTDSRDAARDERDRLTVFGARGKPAAQKPRLMGLMLTAGLVVVMLGIGAWSTVFLDSGLARFLGADETTSTAEAPVTPSEDTEVALLPQDTMPSPVTPQTPPLQTAEDAPEPPAAPVAPPVIGDVLTAEEAATAYAATGIWQRAAEPPHTPPTDTVDQVYVASIDPSLQIFDAVALPRMSDPASEAYPADPGLPPAAGVTFDIDARGVVRATPEGVVTPDGVRVFAGLPPAVPPQTVGSLSGQRPQAAPSAEPDTPEPASVDGGDGAALVPQAENPLSRTRPRLRPSDVVEQQERATLGGISRQELAAYRPRSRPETVQEQAVAEEPDAPATAQAVRDSLDPVGRPRDMASIVERARQNRQAAPVQAAAVAVPQATVQPSVPSSASVASSATVRNAIQLNRINLVGVYGTPAERRALVRLASGKYQTVEVGDRLDGGRVAAIGESQLRYVKSGRNVTLQMPRG